VKQREDNVRLDVLIARHVIGLRVVALDWPCGYEPECGCYEADMHKEADTDIGRCSWFTERGPVYSPENAVWPPRQEDGYAEVKPVPFYSTDVGEAWAVVAQLQDRFHWRLTSPFQPGEPWFAGVTPLGTSGWNGRPDIEACGETPAMAICLCALKALALGYGDGLSEPAESPEAELAAGERGAAE